MVRNTDKNNLHELFPLDCDTVVTSGDQSGVILKFRTFYLKIYDDQMEYAYVIKGYRYHEQTPVFEANVKASQMREFASNFTHENYLHNIKL